MLAAFDEHEAGAGDQSGQGRRDEDLVGAGERADPRGDVHGESADVTVALLDLTRVQPDADVDADRRELRLQRARAVDRTPGPVERREHTVAGHLHDPASMRPDFASDDHVVGIEARDPVLVAHRRCRSGRPDDVAEHDGREHTLGATPLARRSPRHELLEEIGEDTHVVGVPAGVPVVVDLDEPCALDALCQQPALPHRDGRVVAAMRHEGRDRDRVEDRTQVHAHVDAHELDRSARWSRVALEAGAALGVARRALHEDRLRTGALAPRRGDGLEDEGRDRPGPLRTRVVVGQRADGQASVQQEVGHSLRGCRREQHRERAALGDAADDGLLHLGRVHHRAEVVEALIERGRARTVIAQPRSPLVEECDPPQLTEPSSRGARTPGSPSPSRRSRRCREP